MRKFSSLSRELENKNSPIHAYVKENFPNTAALARIYRKEPSELLVPTVTPINNSRSSILGDAFDLLTRFMADPRYYPDFALHPIIGENLLEEAEDAAAVIRELELDPHGELSRLAGAICWFLALTTQAFRAGGISPGSPLAPYFDYCGTEDLFLLYTDPDHEELRQLHRVAQQKLYPIFESLSKEYVIPGPDFSIKNCCKADGDLIVNRTLVETKTRIGRKNKNGFYEDALRAEDTRAVLGYVLFDLEDKYQLEEVAFYSARYGKLFRIALAEFLEVLAGKPVDLSEARADMRRILEG